MADEADQDDKTEEPTAQKLEEARRRGEVVYSTEAAAWIMLAAGAIATALFAGSMAQSLGRLLVGLFSAAANVAVDAASMRQLFAEVLMRAGAPLGLFALVLIAAGITARIIQDKPTWAAQRMKPSFDRIDPVKGFGRVFGPAAFGNFAKAALKFIVIGAAALWALWPRDGEILYAATRDLSTFWPIAQEKALALVGACLAAFSVIAAGDYFFTRRSYMKRMRMTRREVRDELRQSEGDPHIRAKLRQVRGERARRRMLAAVPQATVVVTNPTHYAVALKYEAGETAAPICVAKGVDEVALRIRETAEEARVPIVEDPPLARALYASAEIDAAIPREHYEAVAKVIGYVLRLAAQRRRRGAAPVPNRPQ
ncbi:MAG: flagellar biosynthesis protein FlhB [Hyphomonadaceae bacterium]